MVMMHFVPLYLFQHNVSRTDAKLPTLLSIIFFTLQVERRDALGHFLRNPARLTDHWEVSNHFVASDWLLCLHAEGSRYTFHE